MHKGKESLSQQFSIVRVPACSFVRPAYFRYVMAGSSSIPMSRRLA